MLQSQIKGSKIMMRMKKLLLLAVLITSAVVFQFTGCSEDENIQQGDAPVVPPQSSMVIDFSEFPDTNSLGAFSKIPADTILRGNWGWAALNVAVWNTILTFTLAVPVAAFVESFNHQPVLQPDGSWLWSYTITVSGINHTAKLYGQSVAGGVNWKMLLTKEGFYTDFEWFSGFSNVPATEGTWTLNLKPDNPVPFLFIEWSRNIEDNTAEVKYTNIDQSASGNGSYIHYGKTSGPTYNRFYNIFGVEEDRLINIEWNFEQYFGRVKDPIYFGDQNWYCWDENLFDTICPE